MSNWLLSTRLASGFRFLPARLRPLRFNYRALVALSLLVCATQVSAQQPFAWPGGAKAAVNLAYDDALASQLDTAIVQLNKAGLRGSFYVSLASETIQTRLDEWRAAAAAGHELGNHSLFHQCSKTGAGREWVSEDRNLDRISVAHMVEQLTLANAFLHAIDGKTLRTFTPPCIDKLASGQPYWPAAQHLFVAIKGQGGGVTATMDGLDVYAVGVDFPNGETGAQLIARVKEAAAHGTMVNFTFHGVGDAHMAVSAAAHQELVNYLAANRDIYYVDTFLNIMQHVKKVQAAASATTAP